MKLRKYTILQLLFPLFMVILVWGIIFNFALMSELRDETDDVLLNLKSRIIEHAMHDSTFIAEEKNDILLQYNIEEIPASEADLEKNEFFDTSISNEIEEKEIPVRALCTNFKLTNDKYYKLIITTSVQEKEDMETTILIGVSVLFFLLFVCIIIVLNLTAKKTLKPLYKLIAWLKIYKLGKKYGPLEINTKIEEFCILYKAAKGMEKRNSEIYSMQEHFVGNASHELQTPLSVCLNKIELMAENPDCTESQLAELEQLHSKILGIIKINKSLLLLSRIEGQQFIETLDVNITKLLEEITDNYSQLYENKKIRIVRDVEYDIKVTMNQSLAQVLLTNLVKNAFCYNKIGGEIVITLKNNILEISNTSNVPMLDVKELFSRYKRMDLKPGSNGLGLNIIGVIAERYNIQVDYKYNDERHIFSLNFNV